MVETANPFSVWEWIVIGAALLAVLGAITVGVLALVTAARRRRDEQ